jgi:uncharacterized membrane protein YbaN (DUF454 family)
MKALFRISAGLGLVLLGIIGLILPIMPGWVFLIPGLVLLADYSPRIRKLLDWAKRKRDAYVHPSKKKPGSRQP